MHRPRSPCRNIDARQLWGAYDIKAWTSLVTDQYHADDTLTFTITWQPNSLLPFSANAEDGLALPTGWTVENVDGLYTWSNQQLAMGANCAATKAFRMNYRTYNAPGQIDRLVSPLIDLAGNAGTHLQFHHVTRLTDQAWTMASPCRSPLIAGATGPRSTPPSGQRWARHHKPPTPMSLRHATMATARHRHRCLRWTARAHSFRW